MDAINSILKISFLGIQGVGMPSVIFIYTAWASVKNSGKIGFSLYAGHFLGEILILISTLFFQNILVQNSMFSAILCFAAMIVCFSYSLKLMLMAFKLNRFKLNKSKLEYSNENEFDEQTYEKKQFLYTNLSSAKRNAFFASFLLTITSLSVFRFLSSSIPSLIFQTNFSFGAKSYVLSTIIFAIIFILSEFILYFFLPKLIALVRNFINESILCIFTVLTSVAFFVCCVNQAISMVTEIKFM